LNKEQRTGNKEQGTKTGCSKTIKQAVISTNGRNRVKIAGHKPVKFHSKIAEIYHHLLSN